MLGLGAARVADTMDLLWPFACDVTLLTHPDTVRDAVRFLAAAYPLQTADARAVFETHALRPDLFTDEPDQRWWRRTLARLLSLVDFAALTTDATRTLRDELAAAGELGGNPQLSSMTTSWGPASGVTRGLLARQGVNVDEGIGARVLAQSETLWDRVQQTPGDSDAAALAALWAEVEATVALFDAHAHELNDSLEQPIWGAHQQRRRADRWQRVIHPGHGRTSAPQPAAVGAPSPVGLPVSRTPAGKEHGGGLSRGNWEVRIYAADAYVSLVDRFGTDHPEIVERIDEILERDGIMLTHILH